MPLQKQTKSSKAQLLAEMKELHLKIRSLQKDFLQITKRAKTALKNAHEKQDAKAADAIRKKLGL